MFVWLLFDTVLFFGPSVHYLMCCFGYFFVNSRHFFKFKKGSLV